MSTLTSPTLNGLLATLPPAVFDRLAPHLELVTLARNKVLYQLHGTIAHAYFPLSAVISIDYVLENGNTSEILNVGNEGMLGLSLCMGSQEAPAHATVQTAGLAYRISAGHLMEEFQRNGYLMRMFLRHTQILMMRVAQLAVCNSHHSTEQRLSRHLLETLDRCAHQELACTQESLGAMLGVRREGITDAVTSLQQLGIIRWRRGHVMVLSRHDLEAHACECYQVVRKAAKRLSPTLLDVAGEFNYARHQPALPLTRHLTMQDRRHTMAAPLSDTAQTQLVFG